VAAKNSIVPGAAEPQIFTLSLDVVGDGVSRLDTRQVVVIVPVGADVVE